MSLFEFLMVLVSIIIGLGIAEILTGIARQVRYRTSTTRYWIHSVLVAFVLCALLQQWWEIWALRDVAEWTFFGLVLMLAGPVGLFLISHLMFPEPVSGANFRDYYIHGSPPVWWLAAMTVFLSTMFRPLIIGSSLVALDNATSFFFLLGFATLALSKRPILHAVLVPVFLLLILYDVFQWSFTIGPQ